MYIDILSGVKPHYDADIKGIKPCQTQLLSLVRERKTNLISTPFLPVIFSSLWTQEILPGNDISITW